MKFRVMLPDKGSKIAKGTGIGVFIAYVIVDNLGWLPSESAKAEIIKYVVLTLTTVLPSFFVRTGTPTPPAEPKPARSAARPLGLGIIMLLALALSGCADKTLFGNIKTPYGSAVCDETSCTVVGDFTQFARPVVKQQLEK